MAVKLSQFKGVAPKIAPELLGEGFGQIARNCKLFSGNIEAYPETVVVGSTGLSTEALTIYPLVNPDTDALVWLAWDIPVNVATPAFEPVVKEQRFYYTGDGVPKVSTYDLATSGSAPYPVDYYELGLPLPDTKPTCTIEAFDEKSIISVARDSTGEVTFVTGTPHELHTGNVVAISGFTNYVGSYSRSGTTVTITLASHGIAAGGTIFIERTSGGITDGAYTVSSVTTDTIVYTEPESGSTSGNLKISTTSYNSTGVEVIVVDDTTFKAFLPGFEQTTYAASGAKVNLAGQTYARTYVYTWYTGWGEESVASDPTDDQIVKDGQTIYLSNLPTSGPTDPVKNFVRGIRLYRTLAGFSESNFYLIQTLWFPQYTATVKRVGSVVTIETVDPHNLLVGDRFKISGCTNASIDITDGIVTDVIDARTFSFTSAGTAIAYTADTTGVLFHDACQNPDDDDAVYWGDGTYTFTDNFDSRKLTDVLISDEWVKPPEDLEGLTVIQNNILAGFVNNKLCMTEPNQPHAWPEAYQKLLDVKIVAIAPISGVGAVVLTERQPYLLTGSDPATMTLQKVDAQYPCVSARGVVSMNYGVVFPTFEGLAMYTAGAGARLITEPLFDANTWGEVYDPTTFVGVYYNNTYFASHDEGSIVYGYSPQDGGTFVDCDQIFTAAYNDAKNGKVYIASGASGNIYRWDDTTQDPQTFTWKSKLMYADGYSNLGAGRIIGDFPATPNTVLTMTLWADGVEVFSEHIQDKEIFRLPRGYRADNYEVQVEGTVRVKNVQLGQTPLSLKEV